MAFSQRFLDCLNFVLKWEGGWTPPQEGDPNPTNYGIIQSVYDDWRKDRGLPLRSVKDIERWEVRTIYWERYWKPAKCEFLPNPIDLIHFDTAVNMGVGAASLLLQRAINDNLPKSDWIKVDGGIGQQTLSAVRRVNLTKLAESYIKRRVERYKAIVRSNKSKGRFLKGWLNRVRDLAKHVNLKISIED